MNGFERFLSDHRTSTRRHFLRLGAAGSAALGLLPLAATADPPLPELAPELAEALQKLESYFTSQERFQDVSRGDPLPHSLPDERKQAAGLSRETWRLEVVSDPEHPAKLRQPLTKADGTALDFARLMQLAEKHAVRFAKVMTCLNIGCPLGMGIWEGVPLREVVWLTRPSEDVRRVFYHGYHNDDPRQTKQWGGDLPDGKVPEGTMGFDPEGQPRTWPMRLGKVHWAALVGGVPAGEYTFRSRAIDEKGIAQPLPRPFRKSGHSAIEAVPVTASI